ncbi:MAG TPA: class I SAM-dependent methyltransferase [Acidimicrobiales bacterium]|jgi:SAM-dependent methyltransferase|nr:class I SAM-dependent methyltransferase [Acidimicrobiales bacterium]
MSTVNFSYVDSALAHMDDGGEPPPPFWRHFHWGLFDVDDPAGVDDSPERYFTAAEAMTQRILDAAGVGDDRRILDVGCGFGGTLDHIRSHHHGCRLVGLNIDVRQLQAAVRLLSASPPGAGGGAATHPLAFVTADGCRLPVADGSLDHVLAVECIFHFPSRKAFFQEAARVLEPGGTLALSDFLMAPGALTTVAGTMAGEGLGDNAWYGHMAKPLTAVGYERLGRRTGFEPLVIEDVNQRTLPTYAALRRLADASASADGVTTIDGIESLATKGDLQYHVLAFRRQ